MIDLLTHGRWVQLVFSRVKIRGGQPDDLGVGPASRSILILMVHSVIAIAVVANCSIIPWVVLLNLDQE